MSSIHISSPEKEGLYQVSKWLSLQLLIDVPEMRALLESLGEFYICCIGQMCEVGKECFSKEQFLAIYEEYITALKNKKYPDEASFRRISSAAFTKSLEDVYAMKVKDSHVIVKISKPVLQLQTNRLHYSKEEGKFRPMIFGNESIYWGLQFSYPQIFHDNQTKEVVNVLKTEAFLNRDLYYGVQKWMRLHTVPTPFFDGEKKINSQVRIGKECFSWINHHPQLIERGLKVARN